MKLPFTIDAHSGLLCCPHCEFGFNPDDTGVRCGSCGAIYCPKCFEENPASLGCRLDLPDCDLDLHAAAESD
jgi:hypothetical protein